MKVCELLFSESFLEDSFSKFNICLISLRGLESLGESTSTSSHDFIVVPLASFPQYWVELSVCYPEQCQVDFSNIQLWPVFDKGIVPLCDLLVL